MFYKLALIIVALVSATLLPLAWLAAQLGGSRAARIAAGLGALYLPFTLFAGRTQWSASTG